MLRWQAKAICGLIMAVAMPICFLLPVKLSNVFSRWGSKGQYVLDLLTCFAGGVFLASYLVFMAPAVRVLIEENLMKENNIEYPLPDMIIGLGFFMMLLLDKLVKVISTRNMVNDVIIDRDNNVDQKLDNGNVSSAEIKQNPNSLSTLLGRHSGYISNDEEKDLEAFSRHRHESADIEGIGATLSPNHMSIIHRDSIDVEGIGATLSPNHMSRLSSRRSRIDSESSAYPQPPLHSRQQSIAEAAVDSTRSVSRSMVMMLALSIDSVLEGMTIGLKKTVLEVWVIFIGIIIHESVIAFCLGLQLVRVHTSIRPVVLASIIYTIMNPLGVLVATLIYETAEADKRIELANGILQALTAGCFIYIVFYEILEGQIDQDTPISKILATLVGYLFLASFAAVPGSSSYAHTTTTTTSRSSFDTNIYNATSSYNNNITALYNNISATLTTTIA